MKKVLKFIGYLVLAIVALGGAFAAYIAIDGIPTYEAKDPGIKIVSTPARVEQGRKMASLLCKGCHFDPGTGKLSGMFMADAPAEFGKIYSMNITHDPNVGIGKWTDGQLIYFIRTGIRPDGTWAPPYMPKLAHISDEDMASIIAYLRSDHAWVQATSTEPQKSEPSFLTKFLSHIVFKPLPYPEKPIIAPDTTDLVAYGKYVALGQLECFTCHSADFKTNDYLEPEKSVGFLGGGNTLLNMEQQKICAANITVDLATGLGNWTEEDFIKAVKYGQKPGGIGMRYPMLPYIELRDIEVRAIWAYLQTVKPITNSVNRDLH